MQPPLDPEPENPVVADATRRFYLGLLLLALVVVAFAAFAWLNAGLKPSPASSSRCKHATTQRQCAACCRPDLYEWGFGFKDRCSCNVQTRL